MTTARADQIELAPPRNVECEQALLGAVLVNNEAFHRVVDVVHVEDFSEPLHRVIFDVVSKLIAAGKVANNVTVKQFLPPAQDGLSIPIPVYLARLAVEATTVINAEDYAETVRDLADRRRMLAALEQSREALHNAPADATPEDLAQSIVASLDSITIRRSSAAQPVLDFSHVLASAIDAAAQAYQNNGKPTGICTGLADFDETTNGLHRGEFLLLGARPSMGKSGVALSWALNMAEAGYNVYLSSLEMNDVQLGARALSSLMYRTHQPISYRQITRGKIDDIDFSAMADKARAKQDLPIKIDQRANLTVAQIAASVRAHARRLKQQGKTLDVLIVDHLHLIRASDVYRGNRTQEVAEISGALKSLAKTLNVALVALAQLSRANDREDRRPHVSDLRWAGELEQDADTIVFLHRPDYALIRKLDDTKPGSDEFFKLSDEIERVHRKMEFIVAKQRMGPIGIVNGWFDLATNRLDAWIDSSLFPNGMVPPGYGGGR